MANNQGEHQRNLQEKDYQSLLDLAQKTIIELETPLGIDASGKEERYAAFFGRDSMITCLKLLRVHREKPDDIYLRIIDKTIRTAIKLQGREINIRSGEKPGKIIHEYREEGYYHLISKPGPWYVYPDKTLRNYDTTDATLLFLILTGEYYNFLKSESFLKSVLPSIEKALEWAENYGHKGGIRLFIEYQLYRPPHMGGLVNQGWMDSEESLLIFGKPPKEPVALVESQGYYFKALRLWGEIFKDIDEKKSKKLIERAEKLKKEFNHLFLTRSGNLNFLAYAIFDQKAHILEVRSNPGHCLWASVRSAGKTESIIDSRYIPDIVSRLMQTDLFESGSGIRTLSTKSTFFTPNSYHNGSIWPFDNGLIAEGFENFGFKKEARKVKDGVLSAINHFGSAIELYCVEKNQSPKEWVNQEGRHSNYKQAWTAATILDFVVNY